MSKCKYLLKENVMTNITNKLNGSNLILMFLDYDGTLAPFNKDPARALPLPGTEDELHQLGQKENISLNIITGRKIKDVKKLLSLKNINYAGTHGLEIEMNGNYRYRWEDENQNSTDLQKIKNYLKSNYCSRNNFHLEDKNSVLTLHHPETINTDNIINDISRQINSNKFEIMAGRQIIEIRPCGWDKGKAVKTLEKYILQTSGRENSQHFNIYIGDDTTDEDAFSVLNNQNDLSIYVKNNDNIETRAKYYLNNPKEVLKFLKIVHTFT